MRELLDYTSASHPKGQTMTDKMRKTFEALATTILGDNPNWRESGDGELARQAWQAATLAERERCANLIEKMTAHRRMVRAAINGVKPEGCEYAAAIRLGGDV